MVAIMTMKLRFSVAHVLREHAAHARRQVEEAVVEQVGGDARDRQKDVEGRPDQRDVALGERRIRCKVLIWNGIFERKHGDFSSG